MLLISIVRLLEEKIKLISFQKKKTV